MTNKIWRVPVILSSDLTVNSPLGSDAAVLDDLVRSYPQYAAQLTDMAVALALEVLADRDEEPILEDVSGTSDAVGRAMSRFQNRLYAVKKSRQPANTNTAPETTNTTES